MLLDLAWVYFFLGIFFWLTCLPALVGRKWYVDVLGSSIEGIPALAIVSALVVSFWPFYLASKVGQFLALNQKSGQKVKKKP